MSSTKYEFDESQLGLRSSTHLRDATNGSLLGKGVERTVQRLLLKALSLSMYMSRYWTTSNVAQTSKVAQKVFRLEVGLVSRAFE